MKKETKEAIKKISITMALGFYGFVLFRHPNLIGIAPIAYSYFYFMKE